VEFQKYYISPVTLSPSFTTIVAHLFCVLVHRCLTGAAPQYLSELIQPLSDVDSRRRLRSASTAEVLAPASGYAALNHWRPCSCRRWSTCFEQSSSRSAPISVIFYFQNTPEVTSVQHILPFSLTVSLTIFVQSHWSRLCCIHLSKFIIRPITLHCWRLIILNSCRPVNFVSLLICNKQHFVYVQPVSFDCVILSSLCVILSYVCAEWMIGLDSCILNCTELAKWSLTLVYTLTGKFSSYLTM